MDLAYHCHYHCPPAAAVVLNTTIFTTISSTTTNCLLPSISSHQQPFLYYYYPASVPPAPPSPPFARAILSAYDLTDALKGDSLCETVEIVVSAVARGEEQHAAIASVGAIHQVIEC